MKTNIVSVLISVLIFVAVIGTIATAISTPNPNITGGALVLYGLITLIVVAGFIMFLAKDMGVMGGRK
jgi:hypothetical protein